MHKNYTHGNLIASKCTKFGIKFGNSKNGTPLVCNIVYFDYTTLCKKVLQILLICFEMPIVWGFCRVLHYIALI